jgi:hypothetical protein
VCLLDALRPVGVIHQEILAVVQERLLIRHQTEEE